MNFPHEDHSKPTLELVSPLVCPQIIRNNHYFEVCYKVRRCYYKVRQISLLQSVTACYYKGATAILLHFATSVIAKCSAMGITNCDVYYKVRQNRRWQERHKTIGLMSENNASASAFYILVHFLAVPCGLRVIPLAWFPGG